MASLASYGLCQAACNAGAVTCYSAAGFTFGAVTGGAGAPAAVVACNSVLATCMAACATKFLVEGSAETAASGKFHCVLLFFFLCVCVCVCVSGAYCPEFAHVVYVIGY